MSKVFLIARREYLAFVRTVGFWLSLVTLPLLITAIIFVPLMLESSAPVKMINAAVLNLSGDPALGDDVRAIIRDEQPKAGADNDAIGQTVRRIAHHDEIHLVDTPPAIAAIASVEEADRRLPALLDDRTSTVVVAFRDKDVLAFHVWSVNRQEGDLAGAISGKLDDLQSYRLAAESGVDPAVAKAVRHAQAEVTSLTPELAGAKDGGGFGHMLKTNAPIMIGAAMGYISWMAIFSSSMILLGGVIEEKASKVLEVLLASAPTEALLIGKVLGVAMVLLTVGAIWICTGLALASYGLPLMPHDVVDGLTAALSGLFSPQHVALLLCYFVGGYLMFGVTFAAVGAFCETQKDAQAIMGPTMIVLMIPMLTMQAAFVAPDSPVLRYLSWVPIFSPFLMPLRLAGPLPWWEIAGTLLGMAVVGLFMIGLGRRAFKQGALTGGKLTWGVVFRIATKKTEL